MNSQALKQIKVPQNHFNAEEKGFIQSEDELDHDCTGNDASIFSSYHLNIHFQEWDPQQS